MRKRLISIVLTIAMLMQTCSTMVFATDSADDVVSGDIGVQEEAQLSWSLNDGVLTISGTGSMEDYVYDEDTWSYNTPWISQAYDTTQVVIEDGVTSIGANAFAGMYYLEKVTIGSGVSSISDGAFSERSSSLQEIIVSSDNTNYCVEDGILFTKDKSKLLVCLSSQQRSEYVVPDGVKEIADYAFYNCSSLTSATLPAGLETIGDCAFYNCSRLTSMTLPEGVSSIGAYAFYYCGTLEEINIPDGVTKIDDYTFCNTVLTTITIPDSVESIGDWAFGYAPLTEATIGSGVTSIGELAFTACFDLTELSFLGDAPEIHEKAFYEVKAICYYPPDNDTWTDDVMQNYGGTLTWRYVVDSGNCGDDAYWLLTGDGTLTISGTGAMWDNTCTWQDVCDQVTKVVIEEGITYIGATAFDECSNLTEAVIADSVTTIGDGAFNYCTKLRSVELGNGVKNIDDEAFYKCTSLERITIPNDSTWFGSSAFAYCTNLKEIYLLGAIAPSHGGEVFNNVTATVYHIDELWPQIGMFDEGTQFVQITDFGTCGEKLFWCLSDGVLTIFGSGAMKHYSSWQSDRAPWFSYAKQITQVNVEEGVTSVGSYAFANCTELTAVTLPESLTIIATYAFQSCERLVSIEIPKNVTAINAYTFQNCYALENLTIPKGVTLIGTYAFRNCDALTEVTIPADVASIGSYGFANCDKLAEVTFLGDVPTIASNAFYGVTATCYYSVDNDTYTSSVMQNYGGTLTWTAVSTAEPEEKDTEAPKFQSVLGMGGFSVPTGTYGGTGLRTRVGITITAKDNVGVAYVKLEYSRGGEYYPLEELTDADTGPIFINFYSWNVSELVSGEYTIRGTVYDTSGNASEPETGTITVDNTAPVISNWLAAAQNTTVTLSWNCDDPTAEFTVYRGQKNSDGEVVYDSIAELGTLGFTEDVGDGEYYYYVVAADSLGNKSEKATAFVTLDNTAPSLMVTPSAANGSDVCGELSFAVKASDALGIRSLQAVYANKTVAVVDETLAIDTTVLSDGELTIVFTAEDNSGYTSEVTYVYKVDNTPPNAPDHLTVAAGQMKNTLSWSRSTEVGTVTMVYRALAEDGERVRIAAITEGDSVYNAFEDTDVVAGTAYYYWVTAVDKLGNESQAVGSVSVVPLADTTAPEILSITPVNRSILTGEVTFTVVATDNVKVKSIALACSADGEQWTEVGTVETTAQAQFVVDTTAYTGEQLYLRITVLDIFDNQMQDSTTYSYPVDNTAPEQVSGLTAAASSTTITLNWDDVTAQDFSYFVVEQLVGETYQQIKTVNNALGVYITGLEPDTAYTYRVYAVDKYGNKGAASESLTVTTIADTTAPVISGISPAPGSYNGFIPMAFTVSDDRGVQSISVQISYNGSQWEELATIDVLRVGTSVRVPYSLDTAGLNEGILYVRAVATDLSGNVGDSSTSAPFCQYVIDRTAPAVPSGLKAIAGAGKITLTWEQGSEADLNTYIVYRSAQEHDGYTAIATGLNRLYWEDCNLPYGATYYYRVAVTDRTGNQSESCAAVACSVLQDTVQPQVISISPSDGYMLGASTAIQVKVWDNNWVNTLYYQVSTDGGVTWQDEASLEVAATETIVKLPVLQENLDQDFMLKVRCVDAVGLVSESCYRSYALDKTAPKAPSLTATARDAELAVELSWNGGAEEDLAGYRVYRAVQGGSFQLLTQKTGGKNSYTHTDYTIAAGVTYSYYVESVDIRGNTAKGAVSTCTTIEQDKVRDEVAPVAVIEGSSVCAAGYESIYSAARSTDNVGVTAYHWDFGDGTNAETVQVNHAYQTAGTYTVSLTVWDAAGNEHTQTMTVTVRNPEAVGTLEITVLDESGQIVPNAGVYVNLGSENMSVVYTNANGMAQVRVSAGSHLVGVYKDGYLPEQRTVEVAAGSTVPLTVNVVERNIVVGELTVERMTLEQIRDAGIDVSDPANQDVYEFNIQLTYGTYEYVVSGAYNGNGDVVKDPEPIEINEEDEIRILVARVFPVGFGSGSGSGTGSGNGGGGETEIPMVVVMDIPGTASWLKDFFDVRLTVINQASPEFVLDNCYAHLNVPSGLTLMDTNRTEAVPGVDMGSIAGQKAATAEWILRGDKAGYYDLTADFSAVLRDFNAAVNAQFQTAEPIQVRQGDGLILEVVVENAIVADTDGAIRVGLRNDHEAPYYLPNIALDEELVDLVDNFKTNGRVILEYPDMEVLNTGETIWWDYIVPRENWDVLTERSDEDFYLLDAIVQSLGGTTELKSEIEEVMPFTINGDLIVVTRLSDSGAESDISYVNIAKDNPLGGNVPSLAIRTYRQNKVTHAYEPCSMKIKIKDEHIIEKGNDADGNEVGEDGITVTTDSNGYYCYEGYSLTNLYNTKSYNIRISASRAKPVEIPVVMRGSSVTTGLLTVYTYEGSGNEIQVLEGAAVTILEADSTNATGTTDEDGKIVFKKVDQGYQELIITKDGYLPLRELVEMKDESEYNFRLYKDTDPNATRIIQVSNSLSDYTKGNQTIIPEGGVIGTVQFALKARMAEGETFKCYHYRILDKDGEVKETDTFKTDNGFWLDLTTLKAGDTLEFAVENTNGDMSAYTDSNIVVFEQPDFFNGLVYDLSKIQLGGSISTSSLFKFDPFATLKALNVTGIADGVVVEDDENGYQAAALEYLGQYVFSNTKFTQSFPLSAKYDLSGKLTVSVVCGGSAKTTTTTGDVYGAGTYVSTPTASYSSTVAVAQKQAESERTMSGNIQLDFVFQYDAPKDDWTLTVYLGASATQKLLDKDVTFIKVVYVAGEAELKESVKLEVVRTHVGPGEVTKILDNGLVPESFNAEGEVKASVGLTVVKKKLASVGLYAKSGLEFQFLPYWSLTAKTAIGAEGNVLIWKKEKDLISGEWEASGDTSVASLQELALLELLQDDEERLILAERAENDAGWQGNQDEEQWITDAYANVDVQLVTLNDESVLAVWCDYTGRATDPVALYWSVYENDSWAEPKRVDHDGTADLYPRLIATETGAQLVWVDFTASVANMDKLTYEEIQEQAFKMLGVTTAAYTQDGKWSSAVEVSRGALAAIPEVAAAEDGTMLVSWITNAGNLESATAEQPDSICWALMETDGTLVESGNILAPYAGISDLGLGYHNGYQMSVLAEQESGAYKMYSTELVSDHWSELSVANTVSGEDVALAVTSDGVAYTINSGRLYAYANGQVYHLMHSDLLPSDASDLACVETQQGTVLLWTCMQGADSVVCMLLVEEFNEVPNPVIVEWVSDGLLSAPTAAVNGSELTVMYRYAYLEENDWCQDVKIRQIPLGVDLSLENSLIQHSSHLVPCLTLETYVQVDSLGVVVPDSFEAEIYTVQDGVEKVIARNTGSSSLNVTLQWTVPADYMGEPVYLRVVHEKDCDTGNNTVQLNNLVRELAVSGVTYIGLLDEKDIVTVDVENQGLVVSEETVLQVRVLGTDDILFAQEIAAMEPGAKRTIRVELNELDRTMEQPLIFTLIPVPGEEDEGNNNDYLILPIVEEHSAEEDTVTFQWAADYSSATVSYTCAHCQQEHTAECDISFEAKENAFVFTATGPELSGGVTLSDVQTIQMVTEEHNRVLKFSLTDQQTVINMQVIIAAYNGDGKMTSVQVTDAPDADIPVTVNGEVVKVFLLNRETSATLLPCLSVVQ